MSRPPIPPPERVTTAAIAEDREWSVIERIYGHPIGAAQATATGRATAEEPGDDGVVVRGDQVMSTDTMFEGVHWDDKLSAADVGFKLVAVNASDLGAMGAQPAWAMLALSLPEPLDLGWVDDFGRGLREGLATFGMRLIGGDTTRSTGPIVATLTVGGPAPARPVLRSGARPGDHLWVTGQLGVAAAGFHGVLEGQDALRRPRPPVRLGVRWAECEGVHAMMDLSDGLQRDLGRLCRASGVGAIVDLDALPMPDFVCVSPQARAWATSWGEDYQLLLAASPESDAVVRELADAEGVLVTRIGDVEVGSSVRVFYGEWPAPLFDHFRTSSA